MNINVSTTTDIQYSRSIALSVKNGPFVPPSKVTLQLYPRDVNVDTLVYTGNGCVIDLKRLEGNVGAAELRDGQVEAVGG